MKNVSQSWSFLGLFGVKTLMNEPGHRERGSLIIDVTLGIILLGLILTKVWQNYSNGNIDNQVQTGQEEIQSVSAAINKAWRNSPTLPAGTLSSITILNSGMVIGSMNQSPDIMNQFGDIVIAQTLSSRQYYIDYPISNIDSSSVQQICTGLMESAIAGTNVAWMQVLPGGGQRFPGSTLTPDNAAADCEVGSGGTVTIRSAYNR